MKKVEVTHANKNKVGCAGNIILGIGFLFLFLIAKFLFPSFRKFHIPLPLLLIGGVILYFFGKRILVYFASLVGFGYGYGTNFVREKTGLNKDKNEMLSNTFNINQEITIKNPFAGIFISGGAGSGKSKSLIEPLIKESGKKGFTGVVYDFKYPELAEYVNTAYQDTDIARYYFNFQDLTRSNKINPIAPELMTNESFAREFAYTILVNLNPQMISKPDFWTDNATALLTSVFWYLRTKYPSYCTLPHAISMVLQPNVEALLRELSSVPKCADMIAPILTAYYQKADNQLAGVISSLQISLSKINFNEVYYLMGDSDVNLELNNSDNKGILTIGNNPQLSSTYAPLIGLILTSISKQLNRPAKEKSVFMVDEFPTVYIPNVEQLPATARSNKVATILACQDISQMVDRYGREKAETILSNLGNQFYGRTPNPATARRVSEMFGKEEKTVMGESITDPGVGVFLGEKFSKTESFNTRESDRVKLQDVANLSTGNFYVTLAEADGDERQGLAQIPMDNRFTKTEILPFQNFSERDLQQAYDRVSLDVTQVILRNSIIATQQ